MTSNQHKDSESYYSVSLCLTICLQKARLLLHLFFLSPFFVRQRTSTVFHWIILQCKTRVSSAVSYSPCVVFSWGPGDLLIQSNPQSWSFSPHFDGIEKHMNSSTNKKTLQGHVACEHISLRVLLHCVTRCLACCTQGIFISVLLLFYEALHSCGLHDWRFLKCQPLCKPQ